MRRHRKKIIPEKNNIEITINQYLEKRNNIEIINGDNIQYLCNHYLGKRKEYNPTSYCYNPDIKKEKIIIFEDFVNEFDNKKIVFAYTHLLKDLDELIGKLNLFKNSFKLIFHNSDGNFSDKHLILLTKVPKLEKIFTQNINTQDERITPLPIGLARHMWPHGKLEIMYHHMNSIPNKDKFIYFNFSIDTNKEKRKECFNKIRSKGISWSNGTNFNDYLNNLKRHKFAISPEGNGIDCHRMWECLYLRVVPICKRNILVERFSQLFPILIVDNWNDLNINNINYNDFSWDNYDKLDFNYWTGLILY